MKHFVGAIEAGGTKFNCAVVDSSQQIVRQIRVPTRGPEETLAEVVAFFRSSDVPLTALGLSCFGPIDLDQTSPYYGYITSTPKLAWRNTNILGPLREFQVPIGFDTDVNGAAFGEYMFGAGKGIETLVYFTIGTGIGGGALVGGNPLHGLTHPEMGHIHIPHDQVRDPFCGCCPAHGDCFEGLASGPAMEQRWQQDPSKLPIDHEAWILEAHYIALAVANTACTLSPQRIILGGGVMQNELLFPLIRRNVQKILCGYIEHPKILKDIDHYIVPPGLGPLSGVLGAAALAMREAGLAS
jgi:fructokinase